MRPFRTLALAGLTIMTLGAAVTPSSAMVIYPWCASFGGRSGGAENCGFVSFRQCLLTASGNGGFCKANPWYTPYPPSPNGAPPLWR
jgi:hypothetical protein